MNKIKELWGKVTILFNQYRNWGLVFIAGAIFGAFILRPILAG